jgi:hypothetical protein
MRMSAAVPAAGPWFHAARMVAASAFIGGLAPDLAEQHVGGVASPPVLLQRHVGHVAESAAPPLRWTASVRPPAFACPPCHSWMRAIPEPMSLRCSPDMHDPPHQPAVGSVCLPIFGIRPKLRCRRGVPTIAGWVHQLPETGRNLPPSMRL